MVDDLADGLTFSGYVQPGSVPVDPSGEDWRGLTGPTGPAGDASLALVTATGSATARSAADRFAERVYAADFGVKGDGGEYTAQLQAAINAAQASGPNWTQTPGRELVLPHGRIVVTGVTITASLALVGQGRWATVLVIAPNQANPAITISPTTTAFSSVSGFGQVILRDLQIYSTNRADPVGQNVAHGIALAYPTGHQTTCVHLTRVLINAVPGDGIHSGSFDGFVEATDCEIAYPGQYGIYGNSTFDWTWHAGEIYGAVKANVLLSGTTNFRFNQVNFFVGQAENLYLFNSNLVLTNCMVDTTGTNNIVVSNPNGSRVDLVGCTIRWANASAPTLTYSDIRFIIGNTGDVYLTACRFADPTINPLSANDALDNIHFDAGSSGNAVLIGTSFDLGPITTAGVTNSVARLITATSEKGTLSLTAAAGTNREIDWKTAGALRWGARASSETESGSAVGSNWALDAYDDSGSFLYSPIFVRRSTGLVSFSKGAVISGGASTIDGAAIGLTTPAGGVVSTFFRVGTTVGPTWNSGTGAPASAQPLGSLYSRTDGGVGTTLYVSRGGGTWNPVAGV